MSENETPFNLVDASVASDKEAFMTAFNAAISSKVHDALELKKVEIASNLLNTSQEETLDGTENVETEVEGSGDENAAESSTEENAE
jgi:hypothetical protein